MSYSDWFKKDMWTDKEAVIVLFGLSKEEADNYYWLECEDGVRVLAPRIIYHPDETDLLSREDGINELLHQTYRYPDYIESPNTQTGWIQWFLNEGVLHSNPSLWRRGSKMMVMRPSSSSNIAAYYQEWAMKAAWSFQDSIALLCRGHTSESKRLMRYALLDNFYDAKKVERQLKEAVANKSIEYIEVDCHSHVERRFKPKEIIEWAKIRGYHFPNLLMEALGYATPANERSRTKKTIKGCKKEIEQEFSKRTRDKKLSATWEEEIKYLQSYSKHFGKEYTPESVRNIITQMKFKEAKKQA